MIHRYRLFVVSILVYIAIASAWIFLSKPLLTGPDPLLSLQWQVWSDVGVMVCTALAMGWSWWFSQSQPGTSDYVPIPTVRTISWLPYVMAILMLGLMMLFRLLLPEPMSGRPMMVLLLFPVILTAVLGGLGPGLFCSVLAVGLSAWVIGPQLWTVDLGFYLQVQLVFLFINGITVSWLSHSLRQSHQHVWQQKRLLKAVFEGTQDAIFTKDLAGRYQLVNQAMCRNLGLTSQDIIGYDDGAIFPPSTAQLHRKHDRQVLAEGKAIQLEQSSEMANGQWRHYSLVKGPLLDPQGQPIGTFGIARDVTLLQQTKDQLQRVLDGAQEGFWEYDLSKNTLQLSERGWRLLGYGPTELSSDLSTMMALCHPTDLAGVQQAIEQHLQDASQGIELECRVRCQNGNWRWFRLQGKMMQGGALPSSRFLSGTLADVHARHEIAAAHQRASVVFNGSYEGIMVVNGQGLIEQVNPAFCRITGYSEAEVLGQSPNIIASGLHERSFYQAMWHALLTQGSWRGEIINKRKDGSIYSELLSISAVLDSKQQPVQYIGIFTDISQQKKHQAELEKVSFYDALTGLPNRRLLAERLGQSFERARQLQLRSAVCLLDLDDFKPINDKFGPHCGDQVLIAISKQLQSVLRQGDTLARLGGDEFVVVLSDMPEPSECHAIVARLQQAVQRPIHTLFGDFQLTASIGVSLYPDDNADPDTLLRHADKAMVQAKEEGKQRICWYDPSLSVRLAEHQLMQDQLLQALERDEFRLYYQPKVDLASGHVAGVEALIRWQHPTRGLLSPAAFLSYIEGSQLEQPVGHWVLQHAIAQAASWQAQKLNLQVSINISPSHLLAPLFVSELADLLAREAGLDPKSIELEILESTAIADIGKASAILQQCQKLGVGFALDDFGTGYSSLTYLRKLPVQTLKIDQSFVRDMLQDPDDLNIVEGVVQLAHVFGRKVIAEGVETMAHGEKLMSLGCCHVQGYGIARPMPADAVADWTSQWQQQRAWQRLTR